MPRMAAHLCPESVEKPKHDWKQNNLGKQSWSDKNKKSQLAVGEETQRWQPRIRSSKLILLSRMRNWFCSNPEINNK